MKFKFSHQLRQRQALILLSLLSIIQAVDYSQNGKNWDGTCATGIRQSPVNIATPDLVLNSLVKFQVNYDSIEDQTLKVQDKGNKIFIESNQNASSFIDFWNERGEYQKFKLDSLQWKLKSEHTVDNRQYSAELQIYHMQPATNRKLVISILFDEEAFLAAPRAKTCFVESFKFQDYVSRAGSLEIPIREYLQFVPQDFYFYYGSLTEPQCNETVTWIVIKSIQPISTQQINSLKSLMSSPSGNFRDIKPIGTRKVYLSGAQLGRLLISAALKTAVINTMAFGMILIANLSYKRKLMNSRLRNNLNQQPSNYNGFTNTQSMVHPQMKQYQLQNQNMNQSRKKKPNAANPNSNKNKNWKALNMRQPAGATIMDLQDMDRHGHLIKPEIGQDEYRHQDPMYGFDEKFTDIELEKFKEAFIFFDRDGDGTMKSEDVGLAMRAMGALVSNNEVKALLKKYDPDGTGTIDLNDFIACLAEVVNKDDNPGEIKNAFSVFDKEDNNMLPIDEMRHVLTRIGDPLSQEEVTNFLNILDVNGDGHVRFGNLMDLLVPQTNKDLYAKTVGGEGIERSQMSYGAPQIGKGIGGGQVYGGISHNSNQKKSRKSVKGKGQAASFMGGEINLNSDQFEKLVCKFQGMDGACDWFQMSKQKLEKQNKKTNAGNFGGLPVQHQWKPPRLDQDKYQVNKESIPPLNKFQAPAHDQQIQQHLEKRLPNEGKIKLQIRDQAFNSNSIKGDVKASDLGKRNRRSQSFDNDITVRFQSRKKILVHGQPLASEVAGPMFSKPDEANHNKQYAINMHTEEIKQDITEISPQLQKVEVMVYNVDNKDNKNEALQEYLDLCDFIMRETHNASCNGLWLKGSLAGYQEKAMKLLHEYNYNFNLAKFHILYPTVMAIPEQRDEILNSINDKELESIVNDAIIDLRGCKSVEADEAIQSVRNDMKTNRITVEELGHYQQMLKKLRVEMPPDIEQELIKSKDFSKVIKKKCGPQTGGGAAAQIPNEKKMRLSDLLQMQDESLKYQIITPEMQQLAEYVKKSQQWIEKAELIKTQVVNVKQLQSIQQESRSIPVNFEGLFEELKKRSNDSVQLVERIHSTFIKVNKTRTQVNQELSNSNLANDRGSAASAKERKKQQDLIKKEKRQKEQQYKDLLREADELMITNPEIQKLREHLEDVDQWKNRVWMFLEDEHEQRQRKEVFLQLLRETALFKFEVELTEDLQRRLEFLEWHEKVIKIWNQMNNIKSEQSSHGSNHSSRKGSEAGNDEEMKDVVDFIEPMEQKSQKVPLSKLQDIMQEGESKGFSDIQIDIIIRIGEMCLKANQYETEIKKVLKEIKESASSNKDSKPKISIERLIELQEEGEKLKVQMNEIDELNLVIQEVQNFDHRCKVYTQSQDFLNNTELKSKNLTSNEFLKQLLQLRQQITKLGVRSSTFQLFKRKIKPLLRWIKRSRMIIKTYFKSIQEEKSQSTTYNQLKLLDQQDYDSMSSSDEFDNEQLNQVNDNQQLSIEIDMDLQDYDILISLLSQAETSLKIIKDTNDYTTLKQIETRVNYWISKVDELDTQRSFTKKDMIMQENFDQQIQQIISQEDDEFELDSAFLNNQQVIETLEKLVGEYLPLPINKQQRVQKQLRRERWMKKLAELYQAEKVKLKQVESLVKDSNHADIQEDFRCKKLSIQLKQQLVQCKEWHQQQQIADVSKPAEISRLLEMGNLLRINLSDYVELRSFYQDVIDWKNKTKQILNQKKFPEFNYEVLRKHIDIGIQLDINEKEIEILKQIVEFCAHWKSIARKVLKSRELCALQHQQVIVKMLEQPPNSQSDRQDLTNNEQSQTVSGLVLILSRNPDNLLQISEILGEQQLSIKKDKDHNQVQQQVYRPTGLQQITEYKYYDNKQYCLCRRGDDGIAFMIGCDSCKEWFHGDCVGVKKDAAGKINQYICIGCARVRYNFEMWNESQQQAQQQQQRDDQIIQEDFHLERFTERRRSNYANFKALIEQGEFDIPIFLEEMEEMKVLEYKIEKWLDTVQQYLEYSLLDQYDYSYEQQQPKQNQSSQQQSISKLNSLDNISMQMLKLYLESESFPIELDEAEELILIMKQRKWYQECQRVLQGTTLKQNKVQYKRNIKRLISQSLELKIENDQSLKHMIKQLQKLLQGTQQQSYQSPQMMHNPQKMQHQIPGSGKYRANSIQQQQLYQMQQQYSSPQNNMIIPQEMPSHLHQQHMHLQNEQMVDEYEINTATNQEISRVEYELNKLFSSGVVEYGDCVNLIDQFEQMEMIKTEEDKQKVDELRNLLNEYTSWLNRVRECLNLARKNRRIDEYEKLIQEGDRLYFMFTSVEKVQYKEIYEHFVEWERNAVEFIQEARCKIQDCIGNVPLCKSFHERYRVLMREYQKTPFIHLVTEEMNYYNNGIWQPHVEDCYEDCNWDFYQFRVIRLENEKKLQESQQIPRRAGVEEAKVDDQDEEVDHDQFFKDARDSDGDKEAQINPEQSDANHESFNTIKQIITQNEQEMQQDFFK